MDDQPNGRWVSHHRLTVVLDAHRREEAQSRHALSDRLTLELAGRVTMAEHQRLASEVRDLKTTVEVHDDLLQQARGARNLLVATLGASVLGAALMVVSLVVVLRG